jgi:PAS domain-containing protein
MTHIPPTNTRALYEIALAIKPRATLQATAEAALEAYRQQLDCDAAAVVEARPAPERDDPATETVATAPDDETFDRVAGDILSRLPRSPTRGEATLPVVEEKPETNRYGMALPGFGVLVLCKRGPPLAASVRESLPELNGKLAAVCNRVRFQSQYETQYRELFEDAPVMFALTREEDGQAVVEDCNHSFAETLGYDRETIRGTPLASFYTEGSAAQLRGEGYE